MPLSPPIRSRTAASCGSSLLRKRAASDSSVASSVMLTESLACGVSALRSGRSSFPSGSAPSANDSENTDSIASRRALMSRRRRSGVAGEPATPDRRRRDMRALLLAILSVFSLSLALGAEPDGKLLLPDLSALTPQASDSVSITLDATLLSLAARFLSSDDPQDAAVRDLIGGLRGIYVKSYTFEKDFVYPSDAGVAVRRQLL